MIVNLLIAGALLAATLLAFYWIHRRIKGDGAGLPFAGAQKARATQGGVDLDQFIATYRRDKAAAEPPPRPVAVPASASSTPPIRPKADFLGGPNKLLYLVLKAALPDHQVFVNVRLADTVQLAGQPATPQARAQLAQARIDFLVCNKALAIVAYIDISDGNRADDVLKRQLEPHMNVDGVRYLRVTPNAIPRPAEVRALIYSG